MSQERTVHYTAASKPTLEGAGVRLRRAFGFGQTPDLDPFLLLDDFRGDDPRHYVKGFPWHPHRGIETITYMLAGEVEHGDSMGNAGVIGPGGVQWMTAGSGIIHQELPRGDAQGRMWGFQLWANLPAANKMMPPRYQEILQADIPLVTLDNGAVIRVICGVINSTVGPVRDIVTDPRYLDVALPANTQFTLDIPAGHTAFAYVFEGECKLGGALAGNHTLAVFSDGDYATAVTASHPARFLLVSGKPLREPVAWSGPIVMNTQQELRAAFEEIQQGTFIKGSDRR